MRGPECRRTKTGQASALSTRCQTLLLTVRRSYAARSGRANASSRRGRCGSLALEIEAPGVDVYFHARVVTNLAGQQLAAQRGLELALNQPLERAGPEGRIVTVLGQVVARLVGQLEFDLSFLEPLA